MEFEPVSRLFLGTHIHMETERGISVYLGRLIRLSHFGLLCFHHNETANDKAMEVKGHR